MEEDEKQKLESLRKELEEVRAESERALAAIKEGLFDKKATERGDILRRLQQKEKEIIKQIQGITGIRDPS